MGHLAKTIIIEGLSRVSSAMGAMAQASQLGVAKIMHFGSEIAVRSGATGLSIDEAKIAGQSTAEVAAALRSAGLRPAACVPAVMAFLPGPQLHGPDDVSERVAQMCESVKRLTELEPSSILCLTGPRGAFPQGEARKHAAAALHQLAARPTRREAAQLRDVPLR